ncbi:MAG: ABC transporter ATP-binding protein [Dongiaceae bacterium]
MSTVDVVKVSKFYGAVAALDDVSLTFADGEFFGLLGPSGSGKTTLLRCLAGFVEPDAGDIRIDGRDVGDTPVHRRQIGMVFQNYALFPHMSVFDNVAFGLSVRRLATAEISRQVISMLSLVRLDGMEQRRPRQLSGGQQQRVALARALVTRPKVLLLDEPLGALDKRLRQQMQIELKQIQREVGITTVFVTHDQEEALTLSDRIAILNDGKVVQVGAPQEVYERPRTTFAASFLGDANFFDGHVVKGPDGGKHVTTTDGFVIHARELSRAAGEPTIVAVRPEKFSLHPAAAMGLEPSVIGNRLPGRIATMVYSGSSITYRVQCGQSEVVVFEQNRSAHPLQPGAEVVLDWDPSHSVIVEAR